MEVARMKAERRSALGRNQIKKLRTEGWMPAVIYGGEGKEPVSIQISEWELEQHVSKRHKVFNIELDGQSESVWLQEIEWKATTDRPLHADFLRIALVCAAAGGVRPKYASPKTNSTRAPASRTPRRRENSRSSARRAAFAGLQLLSQHSAITSTVASATCPSLSSTRTHICTGPRTKSASDD